MPVTPLSELPEGWSVVVDTETSKAHPDDAGAAISVVSFAYWDPANETRMVSQAVPFDQGLNPEGLPLGPKALPKATAKRVAKWPAWAREEVAPNRPPEDFDRLLALLARCSLDFHHAKFDLAFLEHGLRDHPGRNLQDRLGWDTMLGQMVLDPMMPKALKATAVRLELTDAGSEDAEAEALKPWLGPKSGKNADPRFDLVPWSVMELYARVDAELTLLLKRHQEQRLDPEVDEDLCRFLDTEHALTHVLVNMGRRGVGFDAERCREAAVVLRAELDEAAAALPFKGSTGRPTPNAARAFFFAEGVRAPYPDKMTKGGKNSPPQPQVDEEVISRLVAEGAPFAAEYERHEGLKSALSKWYEPWAAACGADGRLRAAFRQGGAVSGRLAAGRVNLLAIPHDRLMPSRAVPSVRQLIVPRPAYELWEFDVSQAEIRVATAVTRCKAMLEGLQRGEDSHATTCKNMFGIDEDDPDWAWMRKVAKAPQPLGTPVATPEGWRPIGELHVGDRVLGADGCAVKVTAIPYEGEEEVWEVRTKSGRVTRTCADHLWSVRNGRKKWALMTTRDLAAQVPHKKLGTSWYLPVQGAAEFDPVDLPVDPYLLGVLLGDGSWATNPKWYGLHADGLEMVSRLKGRISDSIHQAPTKHCARASRFSLRGGATKAGLVALGLDKAKTPDKFIPEIYMRGSVEQRLEVLRGLMDTDGHAAKDGKVAIFNSTSRKLIDGVAELVRSLGGIATIAPMHRSQKEQNPNRSDAWFVHVRLPQNPFALSRKAGCWKPATFMSDRVVEVRRTGVLARQRCITVDADDDLYLTSDYIVTHNCNLGILYGEGARTLQAQIAKATGTKYKLGEVSGWIKDWKAALPEFAEGLEIAERQAERHGYVRLYNGRRRYFADYEPAYKAFNQVVQGSLAEMMKLIMIEADATWPDELVLQVHDSLVMEIPVAEVEARRKEVPALMKRRFERAIWVPWEPGGDPVTVPYETDAKRWGEAD